MRLINALSNIRSLKSTLKYATVKASSDALFTADASAGKLSTPGYKIVISYLKPAVDKYHIATMQYAELDLQDGDVDVKSTVELTSHPTAMGYDIADHIYRKPISLSMKGKYAENGLKAINWTGSDRLTEIQREFEDLQRKGTKFNIAMMKSGAYNDASKTRYIARSNMVLTSISWTEQQDTLSFSFDFTEAISSNAVIAEPVQDVRDPNVPAITDLKASSIVGEVVNSDDVIKLTIKTLADMDLVDTTTLKYCALAIGAQAISTLAVGSIVLSVLVVAATSASIPVVGWVVAGVCAVAAAVISAICWWKAAEHEAQIAKYKAIGMYFKITDNDTTEHKNAVVKALGEFLAKVKATVDSTLSDVAVYQIPKESRQECSLTVNGNYYIQKIEACNTEATSDSTPYRIESLYLGETTVASMPRITGHKSFDECDDAAAFFKDIDDQKYRVYIINRAAKANDENGASASEKEEAANDMMNYDLVVSPYPLTDLTEKIANVIKGAIG